MFGFTIPLPIRLLATILLLFGVATLGYIKGSAHADIELANYQAKAEKQITDLQKNNSQISSKVVIQYVDRVNTIHDKQIIYKTLISKTEPQHDLSKAWIELHNASASLTIPDTSLVSDKSPSGIMDIAALDVVVGNYAICHDNKEQLIALQKWIRDNQKAIDDANIKKSKEKK
jgi:hypothetical protein